VRAFTTPSGPTFSRRLGRLPICEIAASAVFLAAHDMRASDLSITFRIEVTPGYVFPSKVYSWVVDRVIRPSGVGS
jgi:hypothetical protein